VHVNLAIGFVTMHKTFSLSDCVKEKLSQIINHFTISMNFNVCIYGAQIEAQNLMFFFFLFRLNTSEQCYGVASFSRSVIHCKRSCWLYRTINIAYKHHELISQAVYERMLVASHEIEEMRRNINCTVFK
jgi:hypothetical protein